jgi:hypothetical protein
VFHDPTTTALLAGPALPSAAAADAYYQTYIFRDGRLYSRYPPGFPVLLAAAGLVAGEAAQHALNPVLYLGLLVALGRLAARLDTTASGAAAAATAMWALLVIPAEVHYWGITVARDLPAHLLAILGIGCALGRRPVWAGWLLGSAASIRPDAILWAPSIALALGRAGRTPRALLAASAAFLAGATPLFAYNTLTEGHPLAFTQGREFRHAFESAVVRTGLDFVSGGAFRLVHLRTTLPAHLRYLVGAFGAFLWLALGLLVVAAWRRQPLARVLGPYVVLGLLFYSCWSHGDPRYLVGVSLGLVVLAALAMVALATWLADPRTPWSRRLGGALGVAALFLGGIGLPRDAAQGLTILERTSAAALVAAAAIPLLPRLRGGGALMPALGFAVFGAFRIVTSTGESGRFDAGDVARARRAIESVVPEDALVLVTGGLGRPAENWTHYARSEARYVSELALLRSDADYVALRCSTTGRPLFLLLRPTEPLPFTGSRSRLHVREVARRTGEGLRDWFVDPHRAPEGVVLYEARIIPTAPSPRGS